MLCFYFALNLQLSRRMRKYKKFYAQSASVSKYKKIYILEKLKLFRVIFLNILGLRLESALGRYSISYFYSTRKDLNKLLNSDEKHDCKSSNSLSNYCKQTKCNKQKKHASRKKRKININKHFCIFQLQLIPANSLKKQKKSKLNDYEKTQQQPSSSTCSDLAFVTTKYKILRFHF